jgi:hypothetical protein
VFLRHLNNLLHTWVAIGHETKFHSVGEVNVKCLVEMEIVRLFQYTIGHGRSVTADKIMWDVMCVYSVCARGAMCCEVG